MNCEQLSPTVSQEVYECRDDTLYVQIQNLWQCELAGHRWLEWRDDGKLKKTGEPCK